MPNYKIEVSFRTDEELTGDELDGLAVACFVQVEDPADHTGESKRARFITRDVEVNTTLSLGYSKLRGKNGIN
jgi:hypothetical protein